MKKLIVANKKEWLAGPYADMPQYRGLPIEEDEGLPPRTYKVVDDE